MNNWKQTEAISTLDNVIESRLDKYEHNLRRYLNRADIDLRNYNEYSMGWFSLSSTFTERADLDNTPCFNVIKSVIDSLVSKLANNKTRPFFAPVNGSYKTRQVVKQVQQYFDIIFDRLNIHDIISDAFRNACIFDIGYVFLDPFTFEISCLPTWCVATLNSEAAYSKPTKALIEFKNTPSMLLNKYDIPLKSKYCNFEMYIDTIEKEAVLFVNEKEVKKTKLQDSILPIIPVYFNKPVYGNKTVSVCDELEDIQTHIDILSAKMSAAEQLSPIGATFIYNGGLNLHASDLNNGSGNIYEIDVPPGMSSMPVTKQNDPLYDPQWQNALERYKQAAYDMIGISQLSAQSKKPSGLDSGAALQTMEDIESDRFETQVTHFVNAYVDTAKTMLRLLPEDTDVLPATSFNSSYTWKDVKEQEALFKIQFSAATALSKDPAERIKEVQQLMQTGLIETAKAAQYLDLPDLSDAYAGASAVSNAIDCCINGAIEQENYEIPNYINYQQLSSRIALVENQLYSSITGEDRKADHDIKISLARVLLLEEELNKVMERDGFLNVEEQAEQLTSTGGISTGATASGIQAISAADEMQEQQ